MNQKPESERIGRTILNDFQGGGLKRTWRQELREINAFYLDSEAKEKLKRMKPIKRWIYQSLWLIKSLFLKLTPARRALLVIAIIFFYAGRQHISNIQVDLVFISVLLFLFILALELKDKLLAHDELFAGRVVQRALLPDRNPELDGWSIHLFSRPANEVSGDLVDFLDVGEKGMGLFLGDVAGKGLGAALFMTKLQATIRALAPGFGSLTGLAFEINRIFCRDGLPSRFISLIYCELRPDSGKIRFINAGHYPPFVVRKGRIEELEQGQAALGIMPDTTFREQAVILKKEEVMLIYSDGVTEARNEAGNFYGEERLKSLLTTRNIISVEKLSEAILDDVNIFMGNALPSDDLSFILIKRLR